MRLLVVHHTSSPALEAMFDAVMSGATNEQIDGVEVVARPALGASAVDVLEADGYLLGTPANLGYISGTLKHFFDQVYYPSARPRAVDPSACTSTVATTRPVPNGRSTRSPKASGGGSRPRMSGSWARRVATTSTPAGTSGPHSPRPSSRTTHADLRDCGDLEKSQRDQLETVGSLPLHVGPHVLRESTRRLCGVEREHHEVLRRGAVECPHT